MNGPTYDLPPMQALAPEARSDGSAWLRPLRDDGSNAYSARPRVRQVLASDGRRDSTASGVLPETRRHGSAWSARATHGGRTVIGIGDSFVEALDNFWTKWEAA
jgi:hypothetical protein